LPICSKVLWKSSPKGTLLGSEVTTNKKQHAWLVTEDWKLNS